MSFLLRDIMERAANVPEALRILKNTPLTCEYYYVFSDRSGNMAGAYCTSKTVQILTPGQQDDRLPFVPPDTVMFSAGKRAEHLSKRLQEAHGKIDVAKMIEIIKRPVAMKSNLHNAIFKPGTLEMWVADAGKTGPACNEPYVRVNLAELLAFFGQTMKAPAESGP